LSKDTIKLSLRAGRFLQRYEPNREISGNVEEFSKKYFWIRIQRRIAFKM